MAHEQIQSKQTNFDRPDPGLDIWRFVSILRRRFLYFLFPFVVIACVGFAVTMLLPAVYVAEGKLLVESQQIPTELVRPTITASAKERIQVIEQRIMTRENLLALADKYQMFANRRNTLSGTELLDLMRQRTRMVPFELDQTRRRSDTVTIALSIGFEYEHPEIAMRVANELLTLILNEDARNRSRRAQETTNFLAGEVKRLEGELGTVDTQISEFKRRYSGETAAEKTSTQLALLKAELQEKASLFADAHPDMVRLKRQIAALEKLVAKTTQFESGLETLQNQRASLQKNLENASQKALAARLGESLERAQFSERLEVIEQAIMPQKPTKPNRPKLLALTLALAMLGGAGAVALAHMLSGAIQGPRDLYGVADAYLLVAIPYITTKKESFRKKLKMAATISAALGSIAAGLASVHLLLRPLDQLWASFLTRLLG
jgi:uncharacterized protein involved in exopolysaccharide biosynthesis